MKRLCSIFLALILLCSVIPFCAFASESNNPVPKAKQAVVHIASGIYYDSNGTAKMFADYYSTGTGFGVGPANTDAQYFVTNRHVVEGDDGVYDTVYIMIDGADLRDRSTVIECKVLFAGEDADYAIIQAEYPIPGVGTLPLLPAEEMETGDPIYVLGFPGIADEIADDNFHTVNDITVTNGIVSRFVMSSEFNFPGIPKKLVAHTAMSNHGNSGGPVINERGEVIAIHTYGYAKAEEVDRRAYATYVDYAMAALDSLGIEYVDASKTPAATDPSEGEAEPDKKDDEKEFPVGTVIIIAAAVVAVAVLVAVLLIVRKKNNTQNQLVVLATNGPLRGQMWNLNGTLSVGRDPAGNIVYPPNTVGVSRNHCVIQVYKNGSETYVQVRDLGSSYGTFNYGSRANWKESNMPAKNIFFHFSVGSDQNSLLVTTKLMGDQMRREQKLGG